MTRISLAIALLLAVPAGARADKKGAKAEPKATAATAQAPAKVKTYDFGGLDVSGRLRTPQLLYFLNRMQAEFDQQTPDKRSFMPELQRSTDGM